MDKKHARKGRVFTDEKLDEIGHRTYTTEVTEMPCTRDRHLQQPQLRSCLNRLYKATVVHNLQPHGPVKRIEVST